MPSTGTATTGAYRGFWRTTKECNALSFTIDAVSAADKGGPVATPSEYANSDTQLARILSSLTEDKAEDIVQIDLRDKSPICDYMVVCTGRSTRQVSALAQNLVDRLKHELGRPCKIEGKDTGDWVLVDTDDVIVHIFRPEVRDFYQLEKMWQPASEAAASPG